MSIALFLACSVKGYLLNAGLCHLAAGDVVNIRNAIDKYQELDLSFSGTRECKFIQVKLLFPQRWSRSPFPNLLLCRALHYSSLPSRFCGFAQVQAYAKAFVILLRIFLVLLVLLKFFFCAPLYHLRARGKSTSRSQVYFPSPSMSFVVFRVPPFRLRLVNKCEFMQAERMPLPELCFTLVPSSYCRFRRPFFLKLLVPFASESARFA